MLIEFSVENFRSFRDRVTLSMLAAKIASLPKSLDQQNVFEAGDDTLLLTSAAIYGANASGKSNLITALRFMRNFVLLSTLASVPTGGIDIEPFLLNPTTAQQPSTFEIVFRAQDSQYRYGFSATSERVTAEWLYRLGAKREARLFERHDDAITLNARLFREGRGLEPRTRPNALFLSVAAQFNVAVASEVVGWFQRLGVDTGLEDTHDRMQAMAMFEQPSYRDAIERLVRQLDVGIDGLIFERGPATLPTNAPAPVMQHLQAFIDAWTQSGATPEQIAIRTRHRTYDDQQALIGEAVFDLEQHESAGTKRLFDLAGPIVRALHEGLMLAIDEIDARIHPNLVTELVRLFNNPETNPLHAQLIFTTHNTNLLSAGLLRRDQIWFVEKSRQGASDLYSLVEYRIDGKVVRNDASYEKDYVLGRYGAVPLTGDLAGVIGAAHAEAPTQN